MIIHSLILLIYFTLLLSLSASLSYNNTLLDCVLKASGLYIHPEQHLSQLSPLALKLLNQTVLVTAFNYGYSNHLYNFRCLAGRLDLKFLVISMDNHAHMEALKLPNATSYLWKSKSSNYQDTVQEEATKFRTHQFNIMSMIKLEAVLDIMKLGYNVIFVDPDVALVRDPIPHVIYEGIDYIHSLNKICPQSYEWDFSKSEEEGNTGFYFVRTNHRTIKLFEHVIATTPKYPHLDDQSIFWITLRERYKQSFIEPMKSCIHSKDDLIHEKFKIRTCPLDGCMFCAGALRGVAYDWLNDNLRTRRIPLVTVHANYLKGNELKMVALKKHGYWIGTWPDLTCQEFNPKFNLHLSTPG